MSQHNPKSNNDIPEFCYLQISIGGQVQPRPIVIHLQHETCPKTCRNFLALCSSYASEEEEEEEIKKVKTTRKKPMPTYRGSYFHRIVPNFMCQAGDFERFDGTGGYSPIYPGGRFDDEPFLKKHDAEGVVSMANAGKNTNKSQFFITLKATPHLDGKHVAFGRVVSGMESVHAMTKVEREGDRPVPLQRIEICDCGIGKGGDDDNNNNNNSNKQQDEDGKQDNAKGSSTPRDSDRKRNKKKHKKRSKSKRRNHDDDPDDDDDGNRHRDRKKRRRKHHRSRKDEDSDDSYSDASSSSGRDGDHSRHDGRKHRSRSSDGRRRRKHSKQHGRKKSKRSSSRRRSSDSSSASSTTSRGD
ncbi:unnamed protein product [Cylindrotheca closterium]|uniref:peptidylprolyl isomerase n=1 Tax=Cylindrotheca closterium TaxID=2856 RepID=A0AAD2G1Q5_9STRA|nr:unnamed protein product [Cylindrotheca closterium]